MKKIVILICALSSFFIATSQELESVGAGVIDFLLTNPSTANKTNATQAAALTVIGNLLSLSSQRKHEINVAQAGRNEIVINTTSGNQASIYLDTQGNAYLLYNGIIHPISVSLVNQAKNDSGKPSMVAVTSSIKNATLPDFNLSDLRNEYRFGGDSVLVELSDGIRRYQYFQKFEIKTAFTCNWVKDFDGQGLDLEDFQGIKRSFYEDENLLFIMGYTTKTVGTWTFEIYESATGKTIYNKTGIADKGGKIVTVEKEGEKLPLGVYIYNFTIRLTGENPISRTERFEIIPNV